MYFRELGQKDLTDVRNLHEEWFPLNYPDSFYQKITKNNVIALGCFYRLQVSEAEVVEIPLGAILVKVQRGGDDLRELC